MVWGLLLAAGQILAGISAATLEKIGCSNKWFWKRKIDLELAPQGTFSERIRAGGAGIPAFFTPTGVGTLVAENKETREFDGLHYCDGTRASKRTSPLSEHGRAISWGNLVYRKTARNFNPMMATAAKITIAEVEHLVEVGELVAPISFIHRSIYVQRIFQGEMYERRIERRTLREIKKSSRLL